jgi:hypothetical protein
MSRRKVTETVASILPPEDVDVWMTTPNRALHGDTPAERIRAGDSRSVLALAEAMADGVVCRARPSTNRDGSCPRFARASPIFVTVRHRPADLGSGR